MNQPRYASILAVWLALLCSPAAVLAQEPACAQLEALGVEIAAARDSDPAAGVERARAALRMAEADARPCPSGKAMLQGAVAVNLDMLGRHGEAVQQYEAALATLDVAGTPTQRVFLHRGLGTALIALESYESALQHLLTALAVSDEAGLVIDSAKSAGNLGILYTTLGDFERARRYHKRALEGFERAEFKPGIAGSLINIGAVAAKFGQQASRQGDAATALREHQRLRETNERALTLFSELGNQRGVAYAESNIGLAWDRLGEPDRALTHHQRSLALREAIGDQSGTIDSLLGMTGVLTRLGRYAEALGVLGRADGLIPQDAYNLRREAVRQRVDLAEARGDLAAALLAQRSLTELVEQSADATQVEKLAQMQDRFDADQAEREIALLRSEARVDELRLQRQQLLTRLSLLVALLAVGLLLVLFSRYRIGVTSARRLAEAARTDPLTALPNRRHMWELLAQAAAAANRGGPPFSLLMADIDDFKAVNDRHGHGGGDGVLREVALRLRDSLRGQDAVARWGGEEFLFLLPDCDRRGAMRTAQRLRERIATEPFTVGSAHEPLMVTLTIGCSEFRPGMSVDECIRAADLALYQGKELGKNRVQGQPAATRGPEHAGSALHGRSDAFPGIE